MQTIIPRITLKGNRIKYVNQFKYLKITINNDERSVKEVKRRISRVKAQYSYLSVNY